jgi:hypothetical protein
MVKRTVEIEDNLEEDIQRMQDSIKEDFLYYVKENPDIDNFEQYYQNNGCDFIHEEADNLAIYDKSDEYYLYSNLMDEAFDNAGLGVEFNTETAYYCLMSQEGFEFLEELKKGVEDWIESYYDKDDIEDSRTIKELEEILEAI